MRHVYICQAQACLSHGRATFADDDAVVYLVDDRSLQRKLWKEGSTALCGDLRDEKLYQRAHVTQDDEVLIQVNSLQLTEDIVQRLRHIPNPPSVAVITENGHQPQIPSAVKCISVDKLLSQAARLKLRQARDHERVLQLRAALEDCENLLILIQHDPDPDAIASGLALRTLLGRNKTTARIGSFGQVKRPENVIMVQLLGIEIEQVTAEKLRHYDGIALVDVQPPYFGDILPRLDAVVDHHPLVAEYEARYRDIRCSFGSTATIFVQYLQAVEAKITQRLATALYYGLKTDTLALERETTEADVEAFSYLYRLANHNLIRRMERPKLPLRDLDAFGYALRGRTIVATTFFTHLGIVEREDVLPQFAEFCLQVEGMEWSVVSGIFGGNLIVSVRHAAQAGSAGELVRTAFGPYGSAGGHRSMAKAVMPLAVLESAFGRLSDADLSQFIQTQTMQHLGGSVAV
jgi:nanoRNase/pAp phosphatase (c-di-AMP/oligoRNAs hydrolase)